MTDVERAPASDADISFFALLTPLVRYRRLVAGTALAAVLATLAVMLVMRPVYTARASFTPESSSSSSISGNLAGLVGLAGQLGLGPSMGGSISPEFFTRLLESREVLQSALLTRFPDPRDSSRTSRLLDLLEVKGRSEAARLDAGVKLLSRRVEAASDKTTSIVTVSVEMPSPALSARVANRLVDLLNEFNLERRQSQSRQQREFTGDRLQVAERELRVAEQQQQSFLTRNRSFSESPTLAFEAARLERNVRVRQEVYLTLRKAYEESRIAEVRDTPVLTVIDSAVAPVRRSRPRPVLGVAIALIVGTLAGVILAYTVAARRQARQAPSPEFLDLQAAWREARGRRSS